MGDIVRPEIQRGIYRHSKSGDLYELIDIAWQTETMEWLAIYRPLYDNPVADLFARPYNMFIEKVTINGALVPRFELIK